MPEARPRLIWAATTLAVLVLTAGCGQTRSIQALPPRPAVTTDTLSEALAAEGLARLEVRLRVGETPLSEEVSRLRLRLDEIRFHVDDGNWVSFPSSSGILTIARDDEYDRAVLSTQLAPVAYDSVEVVFAEVYIEFGTNAGGPITTARPPRAARRLILEPGLGSTTSVELVLNPGASLFRDSECRWHFLPFVDASVESGSDPSR